MKKPIRLCIGVAVVVSCIALYFFRDLLPYQTDLYLAEWELKAAGYYAYVLPENLQNELNWEREIHIYSLGCAENQSDDPYRPLRIWYDDDQQNRKLDITIFPNRGPFFRADIKTTPIEIDSEWILNGNAEYYLSEDGIVVVMFTDRVGMEVSIAADMPMEQLKELISELAYIGRDIDSVSNPWVDACS